jgi:Rieske Fe-S protein
MDGEPMQGIERRRLLDVLLSLTGLGFIGTVVYPLVRYLTPPRVSEAVASSVVAAQVNQLKPNSGEIFRFGSTPGILIRLPSGEWRAFSAVCTHLQCTVQYRPDLEQIWCPCHNGHYDLSGKNISGPPPKPLEAYNVVVKGDDVIVSRRA